MRPPCYQDNFATLYIGPALEVLREMPEQSVHMCVTSPPYWRLRSYLDKDHPAKGQELGTENTPDEFVSKLVEVFAEVWRVLRDDGTLWVNIGDSYSGVNRTFAKRRKDASGVLRPVEIRECERCGEEFEGGTGRRFCSAYCGGSDNSKRATRPGGLKAKDLCMIPARLALALQSWGWYLRQELVWAKDSAMPESVKDRCTRSHEFIYMLTKKPTYFYDKEAIREPYAESSAKRYQYSFGKDYANSSGSKNPALGGGDIEQNPAGRNARSVWRINPRPYPGSHFAVFPPELPIRCIKAGTSEYGVCGAKVKKLRVRRDLTAEQQAEVMAFLEKRSLV